MLWTDKAKKYLLKYWNIENLKEKQIEVIDELLSGNDVIGLLPTGYGKSMCYLLPPLLVKKAMIIISPLISLMDDQKTALLSKGIKCSALHCNNKNKDQETYDIIDGTIKIVYMSPEYLVKGNGKELVSILVDNDKLGFIAIDEAHCISSWGHDFRPEYKEIKLIRDEYPTIPMIAVTATATENVCADIKANLKLNNPKIIKASFDRPNLYLKVCEIPTTSTIIKKKVKEISVDWASLVQTYIDKYQNQKIIIYVNSRINTGELSTDINKNNKDISEAYHAGLSAKMRDKIHNNFANGNINVIVSTIAFGMGIDQIVKCVIIFGCTSSIEEYTQMIGRAGRDIKPAETIFFFEKKQFMIKKQMTTKSFYKYPALCKIKIDNIGKVWSYVYANTCKRKFMLDYFNELTSYITCNSCTSCDQELIDMTKEFSKILLNESLMTKAVNMIKEKYIAIDLDNLFNILWRWKNYVLANKLDVNKLDECMKLKFNSKCIKKEYHQQTEQKYTLYFDGASKGNPGLSGSGAVLYINKEELWADSLFAGQNETNNVAEYKGLILGLENAHRMKIQNLIVKGDSEVIIKQMTEEYKVSSSNLLFYYKIAKDLCSKFKNIVFKHIYREHNGRADTLANEGVTKNKKDDIYLDNQLDKYRAYCSI